MSGPKDWLGLLVGLAATAFMVFMMGREKERPTRKPGRLEWDRCCARSCFERVPAVQVLCRRHLHEVPVILRNQIARAEGAEWVRLVGLELDGLEDARRRRRELEDLEPGILTPAWDDGEIELELELEDAAT